MRRDCASLSFGSSVSASARVFRLLSFALAFSTLALRYTACRFILLRIPDTPSPAIEIAKMCRVFSKLYSSWNLGAKFRTHADLSAKTFQRRPAGDSPSIYVLSTVHIFIFHTRVWISELSTEYNFVFLRCVHFYLHSC
jgi:hypothetical protein